MRQWLEDARMAHAFEWMEFDCYGCRITRYDEKTGYPSRYRHSPPMPFWIWVVGCAIRDLAYHWKTWNCDHADSESFADAENGYEEVRCRKCGWSFSCYH